MKIVNALLVLRGSVRNLMTAKKPVPVKQEHPQDRALREVAEQFGQIVTAFEETAKLYCASSSALTIAEDLAVVNKEAKHLPASLETALKDVTAASNSLAKPGLGGSDKKLQAMLEATRELEEALKDCCGRVERAYSRGEEKFANLMTGRPAALNGRN